MKKYEKPQISYISVYKDVLLASFYGFEDIWGEDDEIVGGTQNV